MKTTLNAFKTGDFTQNALTFFEKLGYNTEYQQPLSQKNYAGFAAEFTPLNETNALVDQWNYVDQLFFLTPENTTLAALQVENVNIDAYLIFGIELKKSHYLRGDLVKITREFNRVFPRPVLILFKHGEAITLSVINRRVHQRDENRDVLEKVTLIKDIRLENPHRAHLDILDDLAFSNLKPTPTNFVELHNAWQKVLNTKTLNKQFYEKLFDWYLFALSHVKFPQIRADDDLIPDEQHQSESLIRLLTRLLFVWFMKEKGLISAELFDPKELKAILKNFTGENSDDTIFYKAILQNLFFATLNMPIEQRKVIAPRTSTFPNKNHGNQLVYRYAELFNDADFKIHFDDIPFLNGGLFDCLDQRKTDLSPEIRLDGFSTQAKKQAVAPDKLFFGEYKNVDLSGAYDNKKKSNVTVYGLIDILQNHKFTVEENTPLEEDIALDPELLGQVFENLLAAYNPETGTTARKQTGSFYTPREIVDYMVDESLIAYFEAKAPPPLPPLQRGGEQFSTSENSTDGEGLPPFGGGQGGGALRELLNYENTQNPFDPQQTELLINAIDNLKILDPACGSGAFPMGILHKLVFVLSKLDPKNEKWRDRQIAKLKTIDDSVLREKAEKVINDAFENNELDYGRKLFLIENCIHGVDIQPIATQISKLRFFISLIVDQKSHGDKSNNFGIRPLPNLDFKIIAANTLCAAPQDDFENNALFSNDSFFENFSDLTHDYFKVANPDDKRKLRDKIETLINAKCAEKIKAIESLSHNEAKYKKQIDQLESHKKLWQSYANLFKHEAVAFFEPRYFFPQLSGGFDIVIGNPPYGVSIKDKYRADVMNHLGKVPDYEIYYYFIEIARVLLKNGGVNSYIIPNTFLFNVFAENYREKLIKDWTIECLIDCTAFKIFDAATVLNAITVFIKDETENNNKIGYKFTAGALDFAELSNRKTMFLSKEDILENNKNWGLLFKLGNSVLQIISKIKKSSVTLNELFPEYSQGLIAYDKYQGQSEETIKNRIYHYDKNEKQDLKKFLWGEDVVKYSVSWNGKEWIDYCDGIANPRQPKFFKGKRLLIREITNPSIFVAYTDEELYHDPSIIVVLENDCDGAKFLLAILNSRLASFYHFNSSPKATKGAFPKILVTDIKNFPIPKISESEQPFITLVDKILAEKKAGNDTSALEREIDVLVYGLYGLSDEEILIVEGK